MKIQTLAVLACAASLFAQTANPCRASFDAVKNSAVRDAAADRLYAITEARIQALESAKDKESPQYAAELKVCDLSVEVFKAQIERVDLAQKNAALQKEISLVKDALINSYFYEASALSKELEIERSLLTESQRELAMKEHELLAQKVEAQKKLDALSSQTINVYRDARGTILSMSDILFEFGKADLKQELKENLAEIAAILKNLLTDANVIIEGHTDNIGTAAANKKLSEQRASGVLQYLVDRGVDKKRLKSVGYGSEKPIADNSTKEGQAKNRRVELVIQDKK